VYLKSDTTIFRSRCAGFSSSNVVSQAAYCKRGSSNHNWNVGWVDDVNAREAPEYWVGTPPADGGLVFELRPSDSLDPNVRQSLSGSFELPFEFSAVRGSFDYTDYSGNALDNLPNLWQSWDDAFYPFSETGVFLFGTNGTASGSPQLIKNSCALSIDSPTAGCSHHLTGFGMRTFTVGSVTLAEPGKELLWQSHQVLHSGGRGISLSRVSLQVKRTVPLKSQPSGGRGQPVRPIAALTLNGRGSAIGLEALPASLAGDASFSAMAWVNLSPMMANQMSNSTTLPVLGLAKRFRDDGRCGPAYPAPGAVVGECVGLAGSGRCCDTVLGVCRVDPVCDCAGCIASANVIADDALKTGPSQLWLQMDDDSSLLPSQGQASASSLLSLHGSRDRTQGTAPSPESHRA
jgi:hypothetical protein